MRCQTFTEYKHLGNMALLDNIQNQLDSTVNSGVRRETVNFRAWEMTTPLSDPICVRNSLLDHILMGRRNLFDGDKDQRQLTKDGLIDAILVLHDYFSSLRTKDVHVSNFVEQYQAVVTKLRKIRVNVTDFEQKKVIGRGHFGEVHLVKEKQTGHVYAMKVIKKADTLAKQSIAFYEEEKDIMAKAKSEWLTSLHCSFQDQENLYLVMEFHPGGDLLSLLSRRDGTLTEDEARFYLAEMILALHTLHSMGYVHRDIKPENVLLDRLGHIKLADFGSSAKLDTTGVVRNEMAVGTAEYIAPEVLTSMNNVGLLAGGYGVECDYWSLGIMAYEMVYGSTPFGAEKMSTTYGNIMNFKEHFQFPSTKTVSKEFTSLISDLLCDSKTRLGYQKLLQHPFFASIDWNGLHEKSPPYIPVISSLDDTSNFDDFDNESMFSHSTVNLCNTQEVSGRNLPFIGFTFVKETINQIDASSSKEYVKRIGELEEELNTKTKEIQELRKQRLQYEHEKSKQWNTDLLNQKISRLELERDTLEKQLARAQRDADNHRRALEQEKAERLKNEAKVIEMIKDLKRSWEKLSEKQQSELQNEIQVWKQANSDTKNKADELAELLKTAMETVTKLEEDCNYWKARSSKYKELAARGHRVGEKRASICVAPSNELLIQTQQQLEKERTLKTELKERIQELEDRIRNSESDFAKRLDDEERRWITQSTDREAEYQGKISELEEKILKQKENRIKELENNLKIQLSECQKMRERAEQLQLSLDDTLQWKTGMETSFSVREGELEKKVKQLEADLRSATDTKLDLQKQIADISLRESMHLQKYENIVVDMREAVERLERKNHDLVEQLSSYESSHSHNQTVAPELEEMKQKMVFMEGQINKLEQQLERSRENLTLEREKSRTLQSDLWKKEKEVSDAKIDLRIANRENKTNEVAINKLKEEAKLWEDKLKAKDEEIASKQAELTKASSELTETTRQLAEKEKIQADIEKDLEVANKAASSARELRRELQFVKDEMSICQRLKTTLESEVQRAEERVSRYMEEKKEVQLLLEEEKKKVEAGDKDLALLKETMMVMDEQLQAFDNIVEGTDKKQSEYETQKTQLSQEIDRLKQEIRAAKQQVNEEKSLKLFTESKLRDVESRLNTCESDTESRISMLQKQAAENTTTINQLNAQVTELDQQLADAELSLSSLERKVAVLEEDNVKLQEESAALRTQLISVKNSNAVLSEGLEQAISKAETYKTKIIQLEAQIDTTAVMHKERELKYESTIAQQTKLIDFLQAKSEQPKKKPTLTDKIFGSHKKENQPSIPLAYRELESNLEKKTSQCRVLTEQLNKCKAEIAALKSESTSSGRSLSGKDLTKTPTASHEMQMKCHAATPIPHRALSRLTQSPGTQQQASPSTSNIGLASQRMHHNIPHRLQSQMVMRATNCAVCFDSIHFGRQVSVCQDCGASAHAKCTSHLPSTCGLPVGLAEHFGSVLGQEVNNPQGDNIQPTSFHMKGWVKIPRPGKATCWDRKFMKLNGTKLCIFDHEPTSDNMQPTDTFDLRPTDSSTIAIHSAVAQSEAFATAKTDVPYMFMIESVPLTTCWPGRTLSVLALNFQQKKAWISALEAVTRGESNRQSAIQAHRKPKLVLRLENPLDVNCVVPISEGILLIGAKEGLFSYHLQGNRKDLVKIDGVTNVQQIVLVPKLSAVLMIVGEERQLVLTELRVLQGCADTIQSAQPSFEVEAVADCEDCHLFEVSNLEKDDIFLCAATQDRVKLFKWSSHNSSFILRKQLIVSETCSCIHFTEHSVLVGCDRFYEVDLGNFSAEEFLDASDSTLGYVVFGLKQVHSFPVAILEVTPRKGETEFLLCYHEFGIFVDGYGRRSRSEDVKWTRLPLAFAYRGPYLFVLHFNSVEIMRLTSTAFKAINSEKQATSPDDSDSSHESVAPPPSVFIEMSSPRYLGPAPQPGSNYFFSNDNKVMDIVQLEAPIVLGEKNKVQPVHLDDISLSGSEFSITPSLANILDQSNDSIATASTESSAPSTKRSPSSSDTNPLRSKRVKFESDL